MSESPSSAADHSWASRAVSATRRSAGAQGPPQSRNALHLAGTGFAGVMGRRWDHPSLRRPYGIAQIESSGGQGSPQASDVADSLTESHSALGETESVDEDPRLARMRAEAILLVSKSPLSPRKLASLANLADATSARTAVRELNEVYDQMGRAIRVETIAGGYRMMTQAGLAPWLSRLSHLPSPLRLSTPMLETLAVVAYRQPVSRAAAESIRGVACGELLRQLMDRDLVRIAGRSEELGRPYLYGTTKHFLQIFGLRNTDALPPIRWQTLNDDSESTPTEDTSPEDIAVTLACPTLDDTEIETPVATISGHDASTPQDSATLTGTRDAANLTGSELDPALANVEDAASSQDPAAVIEDEEDDLYEGENEGDWDDDDWDDPDDEDEEEDDDDDEDDEDDGLEDDDWEEVDDEASDEEIDDDEYGDSFDDEDDDDDDWGSNDDDEDDDENWD